VQKVFVISIQRTGTTSTGRFLAHHGYRVATWQVARRNGWAMATHQGRFDEVVDHPDVAAHDAFEDHPWFVPEIYQRALQRHPDAKFVHFVRDPDAWFKSMVGHSDGWTLGDVEAHCKLWDRVEDHAWLVKHGMLRQNARGDQVMALWDKPTHYLSRYVAKNQATRDFFRSLPDAADRYFTADLADRDKWPALAKFCGFALKADTDFHVNQSVPNTWPRRAWRALRARALRLAGRAR
jgi:hypothetical protein